MAKTKRKQTITVERPGNGEFRKSAHSGLYTEQRETAGEGVTFRVKTTAWLRKAESAVEFVQAQAACIKKNRNVTEAINHH